jgi:hypothetical protein
MANRCKPPKKRTTISISDTTHAIGKKIAAMERRNFSGMLANAIEERWLAKQKERAA